MTSALFITANVTSFAVKREGCFEQEFQHLAAQHAEEAVPVCASGHIYSKACKLSLQPKHIICVIVSVSLT